MADDNKDLDLGQGQPQEKRTFAQDFLRWAKKELVNPQQLEADKIVDFEIWEDEGLVVTAQESGSNRVLRRYCSSDSPKREKFSEYAYAYFDYFEDDRSFKLSGVYKYEENVKGGSEGMVSAEFYSNIPSFGSRRILMAPFGGEDMRLVYDSKGYFTHIESLNSSGVDPEWKVYIFELKEPYGEEGSGPVEIQRDNGKIIEVEMRKGEIYILVREGNETLSNNKIPGKIDVQKIIDTLCPKELQEDPFDSLPEEDEWLYLNFRDVWGIKSIK